MYFILPTFALFTITAAAGALQHPNAQNDSPLVGHLRGGEPAAADADQRDLVVSSTATSKSLSKDVSFYKCMSFSDCFCFNTLELCAAFADSYAFTSAAGTAAHSFELLTVLASCEASALAVAEAYVEIYGKSTVNVAVKTTGSSADIDVSVKMKEATVSAARAGTAADAAAYVSDLAIAYTDVSAVCANPAAHNLPICSGAGASSIQLGTATAQASSYGFSGALGGSATYQAADVDVVGTSISSVKTVLVSVAESFAAASSTASAFAGAYTDVLTNNFNQACLNALDHNCGSALYSGETFCTMNHQAACDQAAALGSGAGDAFALAFGEACASAAASVKLGIVIKVQVAGPSGSIKLEQNGFGEACITAYC